MNMPQVALTQILEQIQSLVRQLRELLARHRGLDDLATDRLLKELSKVEQHCAFLIGNPDFGARPDIGLLPILDLVSLSAREIANSILSPSSEFSVEVSSIAGQLSSLGGALAIKISDVEISIGREELESLKTEIAESKNELRNTTTEQKEQLQKLANNIENINSVLSSVTQKLAAKIDTLEEDMNEELSKIKANYGIAEKYLAEKKKEIDTLVGDSAAKVIGGNYHNSAAEEKKTADRFRYAAITCMVFIVLILADAALSTLSQDFDWQRTLTRVTLVFLLSVPAAYLARESAKHREQQYHFHQTSLDTQAISPFISSLPAEEQHKIKAAVAAKLFAGRDFSKVSNDPFPINSQEILIELIKKLEMPSKPKAE